jgi:hypothetical protein
MVVKVIRIILTGCIVVAIAFALLLISMFYFPWQDVSSDPPTPMWVDAFDLVWRVLLWPVMLGALFDSNGGSMFISIPATVLFWGWVIEIILKRRARKRGEIVSGPWLQG